ncbi:MAG: adenylate/guanylate cyclase domain-containing protein [Armatimonadetes bacterium]|nr:adenylate/guanylate cyclase domain-containing protein [Armatimonadota bacterium]
MGAGRGLPPRRGARASPRSLGTGSRAGPAAGPEGERPAPPGRRGLAALGRHWRIVLAASLVLGLALGLASQPDTGPLRSLELRALDGMLRLRYEVGAAPAPDPRIVLVELDESTFRTLRKPVALWLADLADVTEALLDAGAVAVGVDLTLNPDVAGLPPDHALPEEVRRGSLKLAAHVLDRSVVLIGTLREEGANALQHVQWLDRSNDMLHNLALAKERIAYNNVNTDPDGRVRRIPIIDLEEDASRTWCFATRLAELAREEPLRLEAQGARLGRDPVELERAPDGLFVRVNYLGPPESFTTASFADLWLLVRLGKPLGDYGGKICILAPTDASFKDVHPTAMASEFPGAEIQATVLSSLLTGRYIHRLPLWGWLLPSAVLGVVCGAAAFGLRPGAGLLLALGLSAGYAGAALLALCRWEIWLPLASPLAAGVLSGGAGSLQRYLSIEREHRQVRALFGRMVSPQVMREVMRHPDTNLIAASRKRLTILFSDINDFTPACEGHTPEEVITRLNEYFQEMVSIIFEQGGTIKQFVGDEIMVIFGAPEGQSDHAARAVRTALLMQKRLQELSRESGDSWGFYDVKIGIHTGGAVVGHVGSLERAEYAAVGDNVNLAARIEGLTKSVGASVLVSAATRDEALPYLEDVEWESRGVHSFKGKTQQVELFRPYFKEERDV